ncbi:MAG TPA: SDR family oxidoreductase [Thermoanaerobaculia bacterium]|nr:SDR family oxidoreductase [Thermoanaerobaculia bacterium]
MKVLLTGGTGFLGRRLAERLAPRHDLVMLVRPTSDRSGLPAAATLVEGAVSDRESLARAADGCAAVVHAAALVKILAPKSEFDRINVSALDHLIDLAPQLDRAIYVSSFIALGPTERLPGGTADESTPPLGPHGRRKRWINHYERTKTQADARARQAIDAGAPLSVVYPGVVYGPGAMTEGNIVVRHLLDLAGGRLPGLLGRPHRRWNYVFVEDAADGIRRVLEEAAPASRYCLGGENVTQERFYELVAEVGGIDVPTRRIPDRVARAAGLLSREWARVTRSTPQLTPDLVEIYRHDWALSSERAGEDLGYRPRSLREGLEETIAWLREKGAW